MILKIIVLLNSYVRNFYNWDNTFAKFLLFLVLLL
jgi:hypothetical protein